MWSSEQGVRVLGQLGIAYVPGLRRRGPLGERGGVLPLERRDRRAGRGEGCLDAVLTPDQWGDTGIEEAVLQVADVVSSQGCIVDEIACAAAVRRADGVDVASLLVSTGGEVGEEGVEVTGQVGVHRPSLTPVRRPGRAFRGQRHEQFM